MQKSLIKIFYIILPGKINFKEGNFFVVHPVYI